MRISQGRLVSFCCAVVLFGSTLAHAQNYHDPVAPAFNVSIDPEEGHFILEEFDFDEGDASGRATLFDLNDDGVPDFLNLDFDDLTPDVNFPWTRIDIGAAHGKGENLAVGTFEDASRAHIFDGGMGNIVDMGFNHIGCDDVGMFSLSELEYERKNVGSADDPRWAFHALAVSLEFVTSCSNVDNPRVRITVDFTDTAKGGDGNGGGGSGGTPTTPTVPPPPFQLRLPSDFDMSSLDLNNGASTTVQLLSLIDPSFNSDLHLSVNSNAHEHEDFHVEITPSTIAAPGGGDASLKITAGPMTFPRAYVVTVTATAGDRQFHLPLIVEIQCDPPFILGTSQPQAVHAVSGGTFEMEVAPGGTGPFFYQWYRGVPGMTRSPVEGATSAKMTTSTRESGPYWVRVSNACGSVDSQAAYVTTTTNLRMPSRHGKRR